jgi:hypothetical protein
LKTIFGANVAPAEDSGRIEPKAASAGAIKSGCRSAKAAVEVRRILPSSRCCAASLPTLAIR